MQFVNTKSVETAAFLAYLYAIQDPTLLAVLDIFAPLDWLALWARVIRVASHARQVVQFEGIDGAGFAVWGALSADTAQRVSGLWAFLKAAVGQGGEEVARRSANASIFIWG